MLTVIGNKIKGVLRSSPAGLQGRIFSDPVNYGYTSGVIGKMPIISHWMFHASFRFGSCSDCIRACLCRQGIELGSIPYDSEIDSRES